jgi:hypothetical protein
MVQVLFNSHHHVTVPKALSKVDMTVRFANGKRVRFMCEDMDDYRVACVKYMHKVWSKKSDLTRQYWTELVAKLKTASKTDAFTIGDVMFSPTLFYPSI